MPQVGDTIIDLTLTRGTLIPGLVTAKVVRAQDGRFVATNADHPKSYPHAFYLNQAGFTWVPTLVLEGAV